MGAALRIVAIVLIQAIGWLWGKMGKGLAWAGVAYFTYKGIGISTAFLGWLAANGLGSGSGEGMFDPGANPWPEKAELIVCAMNAWVPVGEFWAMFKFVMSLKVSGLAVKLVSRAFK